MAPAPLTARFQLETDAGARVGPERMRLLAAIAEHGSIAAAAAAVGLSYRGAWDGVKAMNALFDRPLVQARAGGADGGAAVVTPAGHALLLAFARIHQALTHVAEQLSAHLTDGAEPLDQLAWRLGLKTSARNQFSGVIETVTPGAVNSEVILRVGDALRLVAQVTRESERALALRPGLPALALIKASWVILAVGTEPVRTSARNRLPGRVIAHRPGAVNDEITLELNGGARLHATVTRESGDELDLAIGAPTQALIKASHVLLAVQ